MIGPIVKLCVLIWLISRLFTTIATFNEKSSDLHFDLAELNVEDKAAQSTENFRDNKIKNRRGLISNLENVDKTFKKKADTLSRLLKTNVDHLRNETDQVKL